MTNSLIHLLNMLIAPMGGENESSHRHNEENLVQAQSFISGLAIGILLCAGLFIYIKQRGSRWGSILRFILRLVR
jgi:hypothetical protein